ncbi:MAG: hypothetical protein JWM36_2749 [Hyphomicrobiales bacterium]|nr:hypothetical protein [Hyphomicrobiales bacterium]
MADDGPNWSELSDLLDQLAFIAAAHAEIARSTLGLSEHPEAREQLRQALETLSKGQDQLALALRQAASLSGTMAHGGDERAN